MSEKPSPYNRLFQTVAEVQATKGDGGCFMEFLREVKSIGGIVIVLQDADILERLEKVVRTLPDLQTDEALEVAYEKLDAIREDIGI